MRRDSAISLMLCAFGGTISTFWLAGAVRAGLGFELTPSLVAAATVILLLLGTGSRGFAPSKISAAFLATLPPMLFGAVRLYNSWFDGMPSVGGGDAADHVYYTEQFLTQTSPYNGLVGFHSTAHWLMAFTGWDYFVTFRFITYGVGAAMLFFAMLVVAAVSEAPRKRLLLNVFILIAILEANLLPLFHYLQADGFYPQLFGVLVVFVAWCSFAIVESLNLRIAILLGCVVLSRFTYVLNTAELLMTIAVFLLLGVWNRGNGWFPRLPVALAALAASIRVYESLLPLASMEGGLRVYHLPTALAGTFILSLALLFTGVRCGEIPEGARRSFLFAAVFCLTTALVESAYLAGGLPVRYYLVKHGFYSLALLCVAGSVALTLLLTTLRIHPRRLVLITVIGIGFAFHAYALQPYRPSYYQRASGSKVTPELYPLADRQAWKIIDHVLAEHDARFGGFITSPYWPLSQFMNASLGYFRYHRQPFYRDPAINMKPGRCVFWNSTPEDLQAFDRISRGRVMRILNGITERTAVTKRTYRPSWRETDSELSYACFGGETNSSGKVSADTPD